MLTHDPLRKFPAPIINAAGYGTRVGGSCPEPVVLDAMRAAQEHYFEIDDLLAHASRIIARETGSAAGLVTCGASAALTLGAAAVLARNDIGVMDVLPDVSGLERTDFLYPTPGRFDYDHPVRASGGKLVAFSFESADLESRLEAALGEHVAGVVCVWKHPGDEHVVTRVAKVCRAAGLPLILDAAMALPPAENLRHLSASRASLIALSGGKHLGGPQNSGLLFGEEDLIQSAWLQMVDMDVRAESWSYSEVHPGRSVNTPPRHGIGRGLKVGKDVIIGCVTALELYSRRDFASERAGWHACCERIATRLEKNADFAIKLLPENSTGQYPAVRIQCESADQMATLKRKLKTETPKIILAEDENKPDTAYIYPMCLRPHEIEILIERLGKGLKL